MILRRTVGRVTEMTYRPLGDSGLMVSAVGIGCNAFGRRVDLDGVRDILTAALTIRPESPSGRYVISVTRLTVRRSITPSRCRVAP